MLISTLKKVAPWLIAAAILYFIFSRVDFADAWAAAGAADLEVFLPMMMAATLIWFVIDSAAFSFLFTRFNEKLDWSEARSLRGLTYLLTPINWNLGTAAVILHLRTSKKIAALESTSTMVLYQMVDGVVLGTLAATGLLLLPESSEIVSLRNIVMIFVAFQISSLAVIISLWPQWRWLVKLRGIGLFRSHRSANARDVFLLVGMKGVYFAVFVGVYWLGSHSFGIDVPLSVAAAAAPAIMLAASLPFTPAGLGTQQAAMLFFFAPYGDEAAIVAFGFTFPIALIVFRAVIGLPYLKDLPKLRESVALQQAEA